MNSQISLDSDSVNGLEHLSGLNEPQRQAVEHHSGPILVLAGAGSGKTRILTRRVANLIIKHRVRPRQILAVTFTNKATNEMRERLKQSLGSDGDDLWIATFHSAALRILRRYANLIGYSNDFAVYDDQDSKTLMKGVLKELSISEKDHTPSEFLRSIDQAKNSGVTADHFVNSPDIQISHDWLRQLHGQVYEHYQRALLSSNAMDFGDLLLNVVLLLRANADVRKWYQYNITHVLVDEFQDTNEVQYEFIRIITKHHRNLLVVGDDDQSIYAFRGATIRNILEFEKDFPDTKVVRLEQNYRSTGMILKAAHAVIEKNNGRKEKKLWCSGPEGEPITAYLGLDEIDEAEFVSREIRKLLAEGASLSDFAVFYRTNAQSRALEEVFLNYGIAYRIYGGLKFYERKEIKDVIAYLRLITNDADTQAFLRVVNTPARGIGPQSVRTIVEYAKENNCTPISACEVIGSKNKSVGKFYDIILDIRRRARRATLSELIDQILSVTEYSAALTGSKDPTAQSRLENLAELKGIARSMEKGMKDTLEVLRHFLDRVSLTSGGDHPTEEAKVADIKKGDKEGEKYISMMTLHLAKGLEFPVVFLTGVEEGLLPHNRSIMENDVEEERRLCYVGLTRAMKKLYITRTSNRGMFSSGGGYGGSSYFRQASRFVLDIPPECINGDIEDFYSRSAILDFNDEYNDEKQNPPKELKQENTWTLRKKSTNGSSKNKMPQVFTADKLSSDK